MKTLIAQSSCLLLLVAMAMALCWPSVAAESTGRLPRIGVLAPGDVPRWNNALYQGLRENGYVDAVTANIDWRATGDNFALGPKLSAELIALEPDVIFAAPGVLARDVAEAAARAKKRIPIVLIAWDPVAEGLVASAANPGGDITGVASAYAPESGVTKQLQVLKDMVSRLRRVAYLIDANWQRTFSLRASAALREAGLKVGIKVDAIEVRGPDDLKRAFSEVVRNHAGAVIVEFGPLFAAKRTQLIEFAAKQLLPTMYWDELVPYDGGLISYGTSVVDMHLRATRLMAKILRGAKPADLPIEYSAQFRLVVNLKTAKALGLEVPQSLLIQADEVIK